MRSWTILKPWSCELIRTALLVLLDAFLIVILGCGEESSGTAPPLSRPPYKRGSALRLLAVLPGNPPYFMDARGRRTVYLTGSHTWNNF